jgi:hypothetical protein
MFTGINFSPPLYFLLNFCIQLVFPTSIEALRIQSLVWTLIGLVLCFMACRRLLGNIPSLIALMLVVSQSELLLRQSQEARHYSLFFACATWVLYMQSSEIKCRTKIFILTFTAHLCLCQVHYLGIIFSFLVGISYLFCRKEMFLLKRIPLSLYANWAISLPLHFYFLSNQKSLLNTWPKPNSFSNLLSVYGDGMIALLSIVLVFVLGIITANTFNKRIHFPTLHTPVLVTSVLWYGLPLVAWAVSHISPINLFNARYFIPKEVALVFLIGFVCFSIQSCWVNQCSKSKSLSKVLLLPVTTLSVLFVFIDLKRSSFAYVEERNYHYWLIKKMNQNPANLPMVFCGDPVFFPNAYKYSEKAYFFVDDEKLNSIYSQFSSKIKVVNHKDLNGLKSFILVSGNDDLPELHVSDFQATRLGKFHERLTLICTKFEKREPYETTPPS